jgi:serine/threonine-protein kinase HipA
VQASREDEHTYNEIAERILSVSPDAKRDLAELWRRIVFNMLITNVDDHLNNHGFLHVGHGQWRLAPALLLGSGGRGSIGDDYDTCSQSASAAIIP